MILILIFHYRGSLSLHEFKINHFQYHYVMNTIIIIIMTPTLQHFNKILSMSYQK